MVKGGTGYNLERTRGQTVLLFAEMAVKTRCSSFTKVKVLIGSFC